MEISLVGRFLYLFHLPSLVLSFFLSLLSLPNPPPQKKPAPQIQSHSSAGLWTLLVFENRESPRLLLWGRDESDSLKTVIIDNYTPTKAFPLSLYPSLPLCDPVQLQLGTIKSRSSNMVVFCHVSVFNTTPTINSTNTHNKTPLNLLSLLIQF